MSSKSEYEDSIEQINNRVRQIMSKLNTTEGVISINGMLVMIDERFFKFEDKTMVISKLENSK